jgi:hypothetical protein
VLLADLLRDVVEGAPGFLVRHGDLACGVEALEPGAGLDGELVEREVLHRMADRLLQLRAPGLRRLAGAGVDEIEGMALEDGGRDPHRRQGLLDRMHPPQAPQVGIVERLHAERDPVDPRLAIAAKPPGLDAGRVGLEGHLGVGVDAPGPADGVQDGAHGFGPHERGRAAAEEDARHRASGNARGGVADLPPERREKALLVHRPVAHMAVEVAIGAFGGAEGPMHIDAKAHIAGRMIDHGAYMAAPGRGVTVRLCRAIFVASETSGLR